MKEAFVSDVSSDDRTDTGTFTEEEHNTKKVKLKVVGEDSIDNMVVDTTPAKEVSWKEMLLGRDGSESSDGVSDGDLIIEDGDILRSSINGIPAINFSECLRNILIRDMETTVVVKLLGRNIGYGVLHNRISSLWKPSQPIRLMDIKNRYYLPLTIEFDQMKPFSSVVTGWIRFSGLPGFLYKKRILEEIGSLVGKVMKLDFKTDSGARGQFARMAVSIDLNKPLTSQFSINGRIQRVEFESLPTVCFHRERSMQREKDDVPVTVDNDADPKMVAEAFGLWMVVQRKSRRTQVGKPNHHGKAAEGNLDGSRFTALFTEDNQMADLGENRPVVSYGHRAEGNKGKEIVGLNSCIRLKDKASGLVHLEVEQGKAGQGLGLENIKGSRRSGRVLNKTIRGRGGRFKIAGNLRVSLTDAMNSMAKLIVRSLFGFFMNTIGNILTRKRVLTKKLHNIEIERSRRNSAFLSQVEIEVREDLENVLYHEEILWRQKARCDWLTLGDRNTKFFHTRTLRRRKQNQITALKNDLGEWIMDEE
ncbi:hypothetical protein CXB51_019012 [Gossypium anomalum]|uniref:DUF4283 domain-containing protein n=1 Tax=Gossypium anomalum TaxID=47600 RepID=A0A8J5YN77_9ROSI|nr:hypothetical protein CXB51_019012 [Gossypium anomalum]